jgi:hypothetical protein
MNKLDQNVLITMASFLSVKDLYRLSLMNKELNYVVKEIIYYHCINNNVEIKSNGLLLKNRFELIKENDDINSIFNYVGKRKNMAICGGYMTSMFFNLFFEESDIDVYIWSNKNYELKKTATHFYRFLSLMLGECKIIDIGDSVKTFIVEGIKRKIQLIAVYANNLNDVLTDYDNSHNRCAFYLNDTYVTYDSLWSKTSQSTFFYKEMKRARYFKALRYGLTVKNNFSYSVENIDNVNKKEEEEYYTLDNNSMLDISAAKYWVRSYEYEKRDLLLLLESKEERDILSLKKEENVKYIVDLYGYLMFYLITEDKVNLFLYQRKYIYFSYTVKGFIHNVDVDVLPCLYLNDGKEQKKVQDIIEKLPINKTFIHTTDTVYPNFRCIRIHGGKKGQGLGLWKLAVYACITNTNCYYLHHYLL